MGSRSEPELTNNLVLENYRLSPNQEPRGPCQGQRHLTTLRLFISFQFANLQ